MKKKFFVVLVLIAAISLLAATVSADQRYDLTPVTGVQRVPAQIVQAKGATGAANYIVQLTDAPLALYQGGVPGLAATASEATGQPFDLRSAAATAYSAYLEAQQIALLDSMAGALGRQLTVGFQYRYAFNGVAVEMTPEEAASVAALPGVAKIYRERFEEMVTDTGPSFIGAPGIWSGSATGVATQGEGTVIAVIDSGINFDHPSFADIGDDGYDHPAPPQPFGVCDPTDPQFNAAYTCNDKLIGAYTFVAEAVTPEDSDGHGSHTASTAAGNHVDAILEAPTTSVDMPVSGVAPHAHIIALDACIGSCPGTALVASVDKVVELNGLYPGLIDVINYSISGGQDPYGDPVELAFLAATETGVFVSASAGNGGPGPDTTGHRSPWVTSVGASTHGRVWANQLINMTSGNGNLADIDGQSVSVGYGPASIVYAGDYVNGDPDPEQCLNPFPPGTWTGQIVVCDRGTIARVDKGANVLAGGAGGFVLANVDAQGESIASDPHYLPAIHIGDIAGDALRAWLANGAADHMATITDGVRGIDPSLADWMGDFSSRGPNGTFDTIVPDVTAPGLSIFAAYADGEIPPDQTPDWTFLQGTSMSSPHNAGSGLLMSALYPSWSPSQIQSALMTTGKYTGIVKEDGVTPADPFDFGGGRLQLSDAARATLILDETIANFQAADGDAEAIRQLNIASMANSSCVGGACSWTRTVTATEDGSWDASWAGDFPLTITPASFSLLAGESQELTITADGSVLPAGDWAFSNVILTPQAPPPVGTLGVYYDVATSNDPGGPVYSFVDISATGTGLGLTDDGEANVTLPFDFNFFGTDYPAPTPIRVGNNGGILFNNDGSNTATDDLNFTNDPLPTTEWPMGIIPFWDDIDSDTGDVYWEVQGSAPNRQFIVQWHNRPHFSNVGSATFQLILFEGSNEILFQYQDLDFGDASYNYGTSATVGAQASDVDFHQYSHNTALLEDAFAILYAPPAADGPPEAHMPVAIVPVFGEINGGNPVAITTRRDAGSWLVPDNTALEITDLTVDFYGPNQADINVVSLSQDPTNGDAYDNLNDGTTFWFYRTVNPGDLWFVAEVLSSEAPDIDMFVGQDLDADGPEASEELCASTTGSWNEYCEFVNPAAGDYWILVQNWQGSATQPDEVHVASAIVPSSDAGLMYVDGPSAVPAGTPFDMRVFWDGTGLINEGDRWYFAFELGTDPGNPGNLGLIPGTLDRVQTDVSKNVSNTTPADGEVLTYTIEVQPNITNEDLTYTITDTIPAGLTYVPGSATANFGSVNVVGDTLTWTGVMQLPGTTYEVATSVSDPACVMPLANSGAYVNLAGYGLATNPGISGDTIWLSFNPSGGAIEFFGQDVGEIVNFTDDGFAFFDPSTPGANPYDHMPIPTAGDPDSLLAMMWRDFQVVYDGPTNRGVTLANLTSGGVPTAFLIEYDDVEPWPVGSTSDRFDFEMLGRYVAGPGYEYIFAYDNLNGTLGDGTIGLENPAGDAGVQYAYNDIAVTNGMAVCFDQVEAGAEVATITYQATVDACGQTLTNEVIHDTDNPGSLPVTIGVDVTAPACPLVSLSLVKTVGTTPGVCATTDTITVDPGTDVYYCYEVTNTGEVNLPIHELVDDQLGTIFSGLAYDLAPGASVDTVAAGLTISATIDTTTTNVATWYATEVTGAPLAEGSASATVNVAFTPGISVAKTVGTVAGTCAATSAIEVEAGTTVYYCYAVTNTGNMTLPLHDLVDDQLGTIFTGLAYDLAPGASVDTVAAGLTISAVINADTTNVGTWTAYVDDGPSASDTATAVVTISEPTDVSLVGFGGDAGTTALPLALAAVVGLALAAFVWRRRETAG